MCNRFTAFSDIQDKQTQISLALFLIRQAHQQITGTGAKFLYTTRPVLGRLKHLSPQETRLNRISWTVVPGKIYIEDRIAWLKSVPAHLANVYDDVPYADAAYFSEIFCGPGKVVRDGLTVNADFCNTFVHVEKGKRSTPDSQSCARNTLHFFGASDVFGFGVEDKYTIPAILQFLIRQRGMEYNVVNHGVRANPLINIVEQMRRETFREGDVVVLMFNVADSSFGRKCLAAGVPYMDLVPYFERPHNYGEVFFDPDHVTGKGNKAISWLLFEALFLNSSDTIRNRLFLKRLQSGESAAAPPRESSQDVDLGSWLRAARKELEEKNFVFRSEVTTGAIVMNCNPFTNGHRHLIEVAAKICDQLIIFVVEEDTFRFSFVDRLRLVRLGVDDLPNVRVLPSGRFIISAQTFPEYFEKDAKSTTAIDLSLDLSLFVRIAEKLHISVRFAGEEPLCPVTAQYNGQMRTKLPRHGISFIEIPRKMQQGQPISASLVRRLMQQGDFADFKNLVPRTTLDFLQGLEPGSTPTDQESAQARSHWL